MRHFLIFTLILLNSGCTNNALSGSWYNTDPNTIEFDISGPDASGLSTVTVTNHNTKSLRYMAQIGMERKPSYYLTKIENNKEVTILCNSGDLAHDYSLGQNEFLKFDFKNEPNIIKVGFPVFNEHFDEYVIWFYIAAKRT